MKCAEVGADFHRLLRPLLGGYSGVPLYVFDLLHVGRDDLRRLELVERRALLRKYTAKAGPAILHSEHMEGEQGEAMFRHACRLGLEGIVSKAASRYRSGRCDAWLKVKNPAYERRG